MASNWQEQYRKLKKRKDLIDTLSGGGDLAPIKTTKSVVNNRNLYTNGAESTLQKKTTPTKTKSTTKKKTTTTTKKTTTKKKDDGLFSAFSDGYDFGDVGRTVYKAGTIVGNTIGKVSTAIITDPIQTVKTMGVAIGEGFNKADKMVNNAVDDTLNKIIPGREERQKNDVSVNLIELDKFSKTASDEEKVRVLKEYENKYGKDDPIYQSASDILMGKSKKKGGILTAKYYDTETYKKSATGKLSEEQQEIYGIGESLGGMGYDLMWGWMTGGIAKAGGATAKTVKKVTEITGKTALFTRSQQAATEEAKAQGYDDTKARLYGLTVGGFEVVMESFGFDEYGALGKLREGNLLKVAGGEALEEFFMPYIEAGAKTGYFGEEFDFEGASEEAIKGAVLGGITGVIMSAGGRGYNKVDAVIEKVNNGQEVTEQDIIDAAQEIEADKPGTINQIIKRSTKILKEDVQLEKNQEQENIGPIQEVENIKEVDEKELKKQHYQYTPIKTDNDFTRELKESASRVMNNTKRSHEFVDTVSKIAEKTGTKYKFTNNEELAANNYKIEGKTINGLVTENGEVLINIDSQKALNTIVGHETLHLLENEAEFEKLKKFAIDYATTKGDYDSRVQSTKELYKGVNANVENEVIADIIGDYLFTDQQFINNLSVENPNFFQKIYNEIKHWINMATAGSKEARQFEQLKYSFEKALNSRQQSDATVETTDAQYSLLDMFKKKEKSYTLSTENVQDVEQKTRKNQRDKSNVEFVKVQDLVEYKKSGGDRSAESVEKLINNIMANGIENPIEVETNGTEITGIYNGNHRLDVAEKLGLTEIPVVYVNEMGDIVKPREILYNEANKEVLDYERSEEEGSYKDNKGIKESYDSSRFGTGDSFNNNVLSDNRGTTTGNDTLSQTLSGHNDRSSSITTYGQNSKELDNSSFFNTKNKYSLSEENTKVHRAKEYFGITTDLREAGYLTADGEYIDLSGKNQGGTPGTRTLDHRDIGDIYTDEEYDLAENKYSSMGTSTAMMQSFIDEGNIRLIPGQGVDISVEPTKEQYNKLYDYLSYIQTINGNVYVDLETETKNRENLEYNDRISISKMISDIKTHYSKYSLSNQNEDIAPTGNYNVYGEDVKLQVEEAIAPLKEQIEELKEALQTPITTQPTKAELDSLEDTRTNKSGTEYAQEFFALRDKYGQAKLYKGINEYKKSPDTYGIDPSNNFDENVAPATQESADIQGLENFNTLVDEDAPTNEGAFIFDEETTLEGKGKQNIINDIRSNFNIKQTEARELYNKIAAAEYPTVDDVFNELQDYRTIKYQQENDYYKEIKNYIKGTRLDISKIKNQIPDYGNTYRMANMGKGLILGNTGQKVDTFYQELNELFPGVFPDDVIAEADQLERISNFLYEDTTMTVAETISDEDLYELAQNIHTDIGNNERYRGSLAHKYFQNKAIQDGELIAPVETQEEYLKTLPDTLDEDYAPYLDMAKKLNNINSSEYSDVRHELDRINTNTQETENQAEKGIKEGKKPAAKVTKSKSSTKNMLNYLFVNKNEAIDRYARETGNNNIKFLADHVNNVYGEVSTNINNVQTDNNGNAIGKSITDIFNQARKKGLSEAFNDYLFHRSNIARHKQSKGSQIPVLESSLLVKEYNEKYPQFKTWAKEVNQYNKNNLYKQVDAGLYTRELADKITKMYDFYVPFFEDIERGYVDNYSKEIGVRGTIKRAKGGADKNLLDFETSMMKQTQSTITAIRKNQLYREIIESSDDKLTLGNGDGDVKSLYKDENGYYVTAYVDGVQQSARISEDLFRGLDNRLEQQVKDIEQRLSKITKPLQTIGNIRRNLLTSWSPTFAITNPLKDIQDAPLNSKYATSWTKNYPRALKELTTGKGKNVQEFLNMYGQANLMGDYATESGLYDVTKTAKVNKALSKVLKINEVMELVPRYAEYLASLEHGTSQMEALYNAREVTTNFGRGGVITKALNRNGFTFLNASVQGFDKLYRNFSGENGAKGVVNATFKAAMLGVVPALFNELAFGGDDEDEDYKALPDYIKDNYYLIKTSDEGEFIRIPKGRMLSIFGSAARRTLEYMRGEKDAFDGYLQNAYSQVGIQNPLESNIFAPLFQAYGSENGKTWYGTDLVPSRLQNVPDEEQYDETIDEFSIWLGDKLNISPYKINYVIDQYTGGMGDIFLPMMTKEGTSDAETVPEMLFAPIKDKFVVDSTTDNKYVSDVYTLSDNLYKKSNSVNATDEDKLKNQYIYTITSEMGELYAERRAVQNDNSLTKAEKYRRSQEIKKEINRLAKEGLDDYQKISKTENYAMVGNKEFNKYTANDGTERWGEVYEDELEEMNSLGMELEEKSEYFTAKKTISSIQTEYDGSTDYNARKRDIINVVKGTNLTDEQKAYLYDRYYASTDTLNTVTTLGIDFDEYLDFEAQEFEADKDSKGNSISGSKKKKVFDYINSMNIEFEQKLILAKLQYNSYDEYNGEIVDYLNRSSLSYEEIEALLKKMGFEVDSDGNIYW